MDYTESMKKNTNRKKIAVMAITLITMSVSGVVYWQYLRGIWPALLPAEPRESVNNAVLNTTGIPLVMPDAVSISVFVDALPGARVIAFDALGNIWVSQTNEGTVSRLTVEKGKLVSKEAILNKLNKPHGLAFDPDNANILYIAEENRISRMDIHDRVLRPIAELPTGGLHTTRTLGFGPDKRLYVSIGSSCNVCHEQDERRAAIYSMKKDGSDMKQYAKGLRNTVFFAWNPLTRELWGNDMGRDLLGDDLPPDEINILHEGGNYGWPNCYGGDIHDTNFDKNTYIRNPCMEPLETGSHIDLPAHSAPLGLAFGASSSQWARIYPNSLFVAFHGSWNRSTPTGYKIMRIQLDKNGNYVSISDFISGWLDGNKVYGRPVDLKFGPDGAFYISDDKAGVIYRVANQ
jgi:glucose/arabinose dehydrogenase